jgi:hypothetical protein
MSTAEYRENSDKDSKNSPCERYNCVQSRERCEIDRLSFILREGKRK